MSLRIPAIPKEVLYAYTTTVSIALIAFSIRWRDTAESEYQKSLKTKQPCTRRIGRSSRFIVSLALLLLVAYLSIGPVQVCFVFAMSLWCVRSLTDL